MALPPKKEKKVVHNENPVLFRVWLLHHKIAVRDHVRVIQSFGVRDACGQIPKNIP